MLITQDELSQFSGTVFDDDDSTQTGITDTVIKSATELINAYLCFNAEEESDANPFYNTETEQVTIPQSVKLVCYEIASLIQMEQGNNIGINNKSFGDSGSRSFLNVVDFSKYFNKISQFRKAFI